MVDTASHGGPFISVHNGTTSQHTTSISILFYPTDMWATLRVRAMCGAVAVPLLNMKADMKLELIRLGLHWRDAAMIKQSMKEADELLELGGLFLYLLFVYFFVLFL